MLKQNVAERLFMEGPRQEKGTAVETAVPIASAIFCAWGLVRMAAQAASPSARIDSRNRSARVANSFMVTPLRF